MGVGGKKKYHLSPPKPWAIWQTDNWPTYRIFTAEHKSNLTTWISWDGPVGVLHHGEESLAKVAHFLYQLQMEPLTFSCESNKIAEGE